MESQDIFKRRKGNRKTASVIIYFLIKNERENKALRKAIMYGIAKTFLVERSKPITIPKTRLDFIVISYLSKK